MNILVLGAGGFIGSHMIEHLIRRREHDAVGLDVTDEKLRGISGRRFRFVRGDVRRDRATVDRLIQKADLVVDLIAYANPSMYVSSPLDVFELNFMQNLDIAKLCMKYEKRLIQYSSAEVYGKAGNEDLCSEDTTNSTFGPVTKPRWIYATAKLLLERVLHAHGLAGDVEYTIVRPFNFLGRRIDYLVPAWAVAGPRVFPHFMSALLTGGPLRLVDGGRVHRAFLHIEDANAAFQTILDNLDATRNEIFNVGNPANNVTIREFARLMLDTFEDLSGHPSASPVVEISGEDFYGRGYEDGDRRPPDIGKMHALGWSPRYDLRTTLRETMAWYLEVYAKPAHLDEAAGVSGQAAIA